LENGLRAMAFLIGVDEAGYGPNLGPLVVAATVWEAPDDVVGAPLYRVLRRAVCKSPEQAGPNRLAVADSKAIYRAGEGLELLERNVLAALRLTGLEATCWSGLLRAAALPAGADADLPWHAEHDPCLPTAACPQAVAKLADCVFERLGGLGVRLAAIRLRPVFPREFNELVERHGLKSQALSVVTLELLANVLFALPASRVLAVCDKHGGRNRYGHLLQAQFPDPLIEIYAEGSDSSVYRWGPADARVEAKFCARGEAFLPTALASMVAKYVRELSMLAFNRYWCARLPELRPTAGYPTDARRFDREVGALRAELGIDERSYWRCR
jgi:hypothetical protein